MSYSGISEATEKNQAVQCISVNSHRLISVLLGDMFALHNHQDLESCELLFLIVFVTVIFLTQGVLPSNRI